MLPVERTLGIEWCTETDTLQFNVFLKDALTTRRGMLSIVGSIFDPLGLVSPVVLEGRRIIQELCLDGLG